MTRDEFIKEGLARGMKIEELRSIYEKADSAGDFDDSQTLQTAADVPEPQRRETFYQPLIKAGEQIYQSSQRGNEAPTRAEGILRLGSGAVKNLFNIPIATAQSIGNLLYGNQGMQAMGSDLQQRLAPHMANIGQLVSMVPGVKQAATGYQGLPSRGQEALKDVFEVGSVFPVGKVAQPLVKAGVKGAESAIKTGVLIPSKLIEKTGVGIESAGKSVIKGELKIEKPLARKVSANIDEAKNKIVNTISKYGLESNTGNFEKLGERAKKLFSEKSKQADDIIDSYSYNNPEKTIDATDIFANIENKIGKDISVRPGERKQAYNTAYKIFNDISKESFGEGKDLSSLTPSDLVKLKRSIGAKYKNFDRNAEPVKEMIYDEMQSAVIKKINEIVPEAGKLNLEARDLKFVSDAAEAASSRIANQNKGLLGNISDIVLASGGAGAAISNPEKALPIIAGTAGALALKRSVGQGRGASLLIKTGKGLQKTGKSIREMTK